MSDTADLWNAIKEERKVERHSRHDSSEANFKDAQESANLAGMTLRACVAGIHYQLRGRDWLINLYPGNQRIYRDSNKSKAPYLKLAFDRDWTLTDIVRAAKEAIEKTSNTKEKP